MQQFRLAEFDSKKNCAQEILCGENYQNLVGIHRIKVLKVHYKAQEEHKLAILACNLKSNIKINQDRQISRIYSPLDIFEIKGEKIINLSSCVEFDFHDQEVVQFWFQTTNNVKIEAILNVHFLFWKRS